jgi:hypothetical protein
MLAANGSYYGTVVIDDLTAFQFPFFGTRSSSTEFQFWLPGPTDNLHPTPLACNCHQVLRELPICELSTVRATTHGNFSILHVGC